MDRTYCPECGSKMAETGAACPRCGFADSGFFRALSQAMAEARRSSPEPESPAEERRDNLRVQRRLRLLLNEHPALLIDISMGGLRLSTEELPAHPKVEVTLFTRAGCFTLEGQVRWFSRPNSLTRHREVGIQFNEVPGEFLPHLEALI